MVLLSLIQVQEEQAVIKYQSDSQNNSLIKLVSFKTMLILIVLTCNLMNSNMKGIKMMKVMIISLIVEKAKLKVEGSPVKMMGHLTTTFDYITNIYLYINIYIVLY